MWKSTLDWLDARSSYRAFLEGFGGMVPHGPRWGRAFGVTLLFLLALEAVTGFALAGYYAPTTTDAWASVNHVQQVVPGGWFLRGLHHHGATALVLVCFAHLLRVLITASYRAPRELNWVLGVGSFLLLLAVAHTGYLLPGDQRAYWATQVLLGMAGNQPLVGSWLERLVAGGDGYGNLTLTRLYSVHAFWGPALLLALAAAHVGLRRKHGAAKELAEARAEPYAKGQLGLDLAMTAAVAAALAGGVALNRGVELYAPADPSSDFLARPEWVFLPVFQLRHFFTGNAEFLATAVFPGAATVLLVALPFIHQRLERRTKRAHALVLWGAGAAALVAIVLGGMSEWSDLRNPEAGELRDTAERDAREAARLARVGVPVTGPQDLYQNDPLVFGRRVFGGKCADCHTPCDQEPYQGAMCLEGYASRAWLTKLLLGPHAPRFFGNTKMRDMDPFVGSETDLEALVEFLYAQGNRPDARASLATRGREVYATESCESCHTLDGEGLDLAPDLLGYATEAWLTAFIRNPDAPRFYGRANEMEAYDHDELSNAELRAVIAFLRHQGEAPANFSE